MTVLVNKDKTVVNIQCSCGLPDHMLQIQKIAFGDVTYYELYVLPQPIDSLWERMKKAWNLLLGREICVKDMVLDPKELIDLNEWITNEVKHDLRGHDKSDQNTF